MIKVWQTAITRNKLSLPVKLYKHLLNGKILDFGAGMGEDVQLLRQEGYDIVGYDKYNYTELNALGQKYDCIICNYVLNVIPEFIDRILALELIVSLLNNRGKVFISVRNESPNVLKNKIQYKDGWLTSKQTFQKFYNQEELLELVLQFFPDVKILSNNPLIIIAYKNKEDL